MTFQLQSNLKSHSIFCNGQKHFHHVSLCRLNHIFSPPALSLDNMSFSFSNTTLWLECSLVSGLLCSQVSSGFQLYCDCGTQAAPPKNSEFMLVSRKTLKIFCHCLSPPRCWRMLESLQSVQFQTLSTCSFKSDYNFSFDVSCPVFLFVWYVLNSSDCLKISLFHRLLKFSKSQFNKIKNVWKMWNT